MKDPIWKEYLDKLPLGENNTFLLNKKASSKAIGVG